MNTKVLFLLFALLLFSMAKAQKPDRTFGSRLVYGGGLGAQFGDITLVQVAPTIGYKLTDEWIVGIGARYIYLKDKLYDYETNIYGGSVYTQYYFLENFVAHTEVEQLSLEAYNIPLDRLERVSVTSVLAGGGIRMLVGGNTYFVLMALWNLNASIYSPYANPVIRAGIAVGL